MGEEELVEFPADYNHIDKEQLIKQYATLGADIKAAYELGDQVELPPAKAPFDHIFFLGMGGSSISGEFIRMFLERLGCPIPVSVVRNYSISEKLTPNSLVFAISYSGNTEETISAYRQAIRVTKYTIGIEDGGKLEEISKLNRSTYLEIPKGYQPRTAALSWTMFTVIKILERYGIIEPQTEAVDHVAKSVNKDELKDHAIAISEKLMHSVPLIYSSEQYFPVAYRMKTQINEHAKVHAFANQYSELNHNEIVGFTNLQAQYHIITFIFDDDHRRIKKRMELTKELTNTKGVATTEIKLSGDHFLTKIFTGVLIGDYAAYYLALRYKTDPSPVDIIEDLKEKMGPFI